MSQREHWRATEHSRPNMPLGPEGCFEVKTTEKKQIREKLSAPQIYPNVGHKFATVSPSPLYQEGQKFGPETTLDPDRHPRQLQREQAPNLALVCPVFSSLPSAPPRVSSSFVFHFTTDLLFCGCGFMEACALNTLRITRRRSPECVCDTRIIKPLLVFLSPLRVIYGALAGEPAGRRNELLPPLRFPVLAVPRAPRPSERGASPPTTS